LETVLKFFFMFANDFLDFSNEFLFLFVLALNNVFERMVVLLFILNGQLLLELLPFLVEIGIDAFLLR
jgi:hypothetical protein